MLFLLCNILAKSYKIKLTEEERYFSINQTDKITIKLDQYKSAENFDIQYDNDKPDKKWLIPLSDKTKAFTSKKSSFELIEFKKTKEQLFNIVPLDLSKKSFWIIYNGKCLTYKDDTNVFMTEPCFENLPKQQFSIKPVEENPGEGKKPNAVANANSMDNDSRIEPGDIRSEILKTISDESKSILVAAHKLLYDMILCFTNKGICTAKDTKYVFRTENSYNARN